MSYIEDLLTGLGLYLHEVGAGVWSPGVAIPEGATGIVIGSIPQAPDRIIALTGYPVTDDPALSDAIIGVNVRIRGDTDVRTVIRMSDTVFDVVHGLTHFVVGPPSARVHLNQLYRRSQADLGPDTNGRLERSENYYCEVNRPHPRLE